MLGRFMAWWRSFASGPSAAGEARPRSARATELPRAEDPPPVPAVEQAHRDFLSFALDGGAADPAAADEDHHAAILELAAAALARFEVHARYLPRRPSLLPRLLSAMNSDTNSMRELAAIIGGDPTLLGNLLRVANSAFYRVSGGKPIETLERAVILVGTDGIRSLIATSLMHPVMSSAGGCFARFPDTIWEQTQFAADAAELHAAQMERTDAFGARMLALLIGLATNTVFRIVRDEALGGREQGAKPAMIELLETWTLPIAARIAASWELPAELQQALERPDSPLMKSVRFGGLAGSQVSMIKRGRLKDAAARATVLASDSRRAQVERIWNRVAVAALRPQPASAKPRGH